MQHALQAQPSVLRHRDGHHAKVTFEEPFFDLVSVFAVTQISHALLHHLSWAGLIAGGGLVGQPRRMSACAVQQKESPKATLFYSGKAKRSLR